MTKRIFYLLAYDISNDRRRLKIAKLCKAVADRVQASVFEAYLTEKELHELLKKSKRVMDDQEDSLRVYHLCAACRGKVITRGCGQITKPPEVTIV